jgi:phosphatidylglycerophosphatase C
VSGVEDRSGGLSSPTEGRRLRVAAFDVDGTLTTSDCVVAFLRRVAGTRTLATAPLRHPGALTSGMVRRDRDGLKALATRVAFTGRSVADVEVLADRFAEEVAERALRDDTLGALRAHQAERDLTVFVSASFELYLRPLAALLGVDEVLGTRLSTRDGRFDGTLEGPNCRGPEKVDRLHRLLEPTGGRGAYEVIAYGDSAGDRELLADADEAHWTGRYRP